MRQYNSGIWPRASKIVVREGGCTEGGHTEGGRKEGEGAQRERMHGGRGCMEGEGTEGEGAWREGAQREGAWRGRGRTWRERKGGWVRDSSEIMVNATLEVTLSRTKVLFRDGLIQSHLVTRETSTGRVPLVSLQA